MMILRNIRYCLLLILLFIGCLPENDEVTVKIINNSFDTAFENRDIKNIIFYDNWRGTSYGREISIDIVLELDSSYDARALLESENYWGFHKLLDYPVDLPRVGSYHKELEKEGHILMDMKDSIAVDMGENIVKVGTDYTICVFREDLNKLYIYSYAQ